MYRLIYPRTARDSKPDKTINCASISSAEGNIPDSIKPFGISFFMLGVPFKELSEQYRVIHYTEGLTKEQVQLMNFEYAATLEEAIQLAFKSTPKADVTILPSGGTIIPVVSRQ